MAIQIVSYLCVCVSLSVCLRMYVSVCILYTGSDDANVSHLHVCVFVCVVSVVEWSVCVCVRACVCVCMYVCMFGCVMSVV